MSCDVPDADGDGVASTACGGNDCDDSNRDVSPNATEVCDLAGVDEDCRPDTLGDRDADGDDRVSSECCNGERCGLDCDDSNAAVYASATEVCNGIDDDCDGRIDEGVQVPLWVDADRDGAGDSAMPVVACADTTGFVNNDDDCDDADPTVNPSALEICDDVDNDCDLRVDEESVAVSWYVDDDEDGYGVASDTPVVSCAPVEGRASRDGDCDDSRGDVHPGADERCNGRDDDCNGLLDFPGEDEDADGYADCVDLPASLRDCDDTRSSVHPGADELCDGVDTNCDGVRPAGDDEDGDGFASPTSTCVGGAPRTDCDDTRATASPGWTREACDGVDNDCDVAIDEACDGGQCDPTADASVFDRSTLRSAIAACETSCVADTECLGRCLERTLGGMTSGQCGTCLSTFVMSLQFGLEAIDGSFAACLDDEACFANVCEQTGEGASACTGVLIEGCPLYRCEQRFDAYRRCQTAACSDASCVSPCAAPVRSWCRPCLDGLLACQNASCASSCSAPTSRACTDCLLANCAASYTACHGGRSLTVPACGTADATALESASAPPEPCLDACYASLGGGSAGRMCGADCINGSVEREVEFGCASCYLLPTTCRGMESRVGGACHTPCMTPSPACDACLCAACEQSFLGCTGFESSFCD
ncbi:MAG: putative metal-binding motif-containing protein [Sandaracinus sp.]|nr:putative metal-binding motif-containing protein [Myxococcales bacterium]MCB9604482.1 putative metal-binding motif-containing protein [Sandaracinus sp.]MCB9618097.1 putative metal-binding motif-containing protein [Sandaracinus sp.]